MLACSRYRRYGRAVAAFLLASATFSPFNTFNLHYAHASGIQKATLGTLTAAGCAVSILSAFANGWLTASAPHGSLPSTWRCIAPSRRLASPSCGTPPASASFTSSMS
jgi:hypothetical protein